MSVVKFSPTISGKPNIYNKSSDDKQIGQLLAIGTWSGNFLIYDVKTDFINPYGWQKKVTEIKEIINQTMPE